ncbi:PfkB family carbohydrate kinase [Actinoplanes flavus]|uniref:Bifunctional hydroxymethylpyrimidine kinase/phosphomethylpyrimidine kinase n=1 Tax=Actinoplanes flavus TaxID=2820290 RepID=A0ABS3UGD3_9ACTN|nr:PfkB family carbohydrate kinase [Actinoplanes flavus]MBO3737839.1 bifunctional hydroxymethylpyrimidine kinase/phosphomethylpyrimidine kinase [Actinoplanes flavus]
MPHPRTVVAGQLARDLVLRVDEMPAAGQSADADLRREMLGGKGANQAVALAQLGMSPALVAVCGTDRAGGELLDQARRDGVDVSRVVRRDGAPTGLIVEALDASGGWRYLQHLPPPMLLTEADVSRAADLIGTAEAVLVQLQQPPRAALAAARLGRDAGALVVLDGAPEPGPERDALLAAADVLRADAHEARSLTGCPDDDPDALLAAARRLMRSGPGLLALGVSGGNLFVWRDGHLLVPLTDEKTVDTTGAGDALTAALTAALLRGRPPEEAARYAVAAAGVTVRHPGGRPDLHESELRSRT